MVRGSSKIAKYLNTHPMFKTKRSIAVHEFFEYYEDFYESRTGDNAEFWRMMDHAIWCDYNFKHITKADCDKFFKEIIEPLWCKFYKVKTSGFFEAQLPAVPKGLLKIPVKL